jgi:hypothetical protein
VTKATLYFSLRTAVAKRALLHTRIGDIKTTKLSEWKMKAKYFRLAGHSNILCIQ